MTLFEPLSGTPSALSGPAAGRYRELYDLLYSNGADAGPQAEVFLRQQMARAAELPCDLPEAPEQLSAWAQARCAAVAQDYAGYLEERKQGGARRYFSNKAHALYFLQRVAPTKEVDGAWLAGVLEHWQDVRYDGLLNTYLEELGRGDPRQNHVVIYRNLLAAHDCGDKQGLADEYFVQGAIQLALGQCSDAFMPEVIGYNLGYEQLPLHLLITSYELNEFGIDPYYFTLHVTVDNAANGHAQKAVQALRQLLPLVGDRDQFMQRVVDGYRLNDLGASTTSVIASFDIERELCTILQAKAVVGRNMHSDYCRVEGRSVNDWLSDPAQIPGFLRAMESSGWIKRGEAVEHSRFWGLVHGERAQMFGVFSNYQQQVLRDWICSRPDAPARSFRVQQRSLEELAPHRPRNERQPRSLLRHHAQEPEHKNELHLLEERVASGGSKADIMAILLPLLAPSTHHTAAGLMATRMFSRLLDA